MRLLATGSFMVGQLGPSQQPFVAFGLVPEAELQFAEMPTRYRPVNSRAMKKS